MKDIRANTATWQESRKRWRIVVKRDGVRKEFNSSTPGRAGQREANAKADAWLSGSAPTRRLTVKKAVQEYKEYLAELQCMKRGLKYDAEKINTRMLGSSRATVSALETWLVPVCGHKQLSALNDGDVQKVLDRAAASGLALKTIKTIRSGITSFIKYYRRQGMTTYRPDDVSIPSSARPKGKTILQPEDLHILMTDDETMFGGKIRQEPYIHAFRLQVLTGMRPGEIIGLEWQDVDFKHDMIHVRRSVNLYGETTSGKNENALRDIRMTPMVRKELLEQKILFGADECVFPIPSGRSYRDHLKRFCENHEMTVVTPYELRHTFVSMCQSLPEGDLRAIVGHSANMDTYGIYAHQVDGHSDAVTAQLEQIFQSIL